MGADKNALKIEVAIQRSVISLSQITRDFLHKGIELTRICRPAVLLKECGVNPDSIFYHNLAKECIDTQRNDGGWTDVLETMWCSKFLNLYSEFSDHLEKASKWLRGQRCKSGGWGKSKRDSARIPITGLLIYMLPQLSSDKDLQWLENKWYQEQQTEPCLTYKAAFTLMAFSQNNYCPKNEDLIEKTVHWLYCQQNDDGGWGSWREHPVGSDPWCTGICTLGLLQYPDKISQKILWKALNWLKEKQLPNGLWPYHYIEEGSIWALYSLIMGYSFLRKK